MGMGQRMVDSGVRGIVAAMAMSGARSLTTSLGLIDQTPPEAVLHQKAGGPMGKLSRGQQQAATELVHWGMGFVAGAAFALIPSLVRRQPWAGAAYGLAVLTGFEAGAAPLLGLTQAKHPRPAERLIFLADHLLYGVVLAPPRRTRA